MIGGQDTQLYKMESLAASIVLELKSKQLKMILSFLDALLSKMGIFSQ